jgi:putative transposase
MTAESKLEVLRAVEESGLPVKDVLSQLAISSSTYYRWRQNFRQRGQPGLHDRKTKSGRIWNQILPEERDKILEIALLYPDWSPRQVSCHITDTAGFAVSESSVYRILKREGLIHEVQQRTFPAGGEYRVRTSRPNQQWQTDATYLAGQELGLVLPDFGIG